MENIKRSFYFKTIAITLIFTFLLYDITWAQGGNPIWGDVKSATSATQVASSATDATKRTDITIPHEAGRVSYSAIHSSSDDLIINIQDAHASLSAQHSIAKMLDSLAANYDLNLIAVEGSEGYVDTSILKTFPDKNISKKTAETLMQEGKMSAGEFFAATSDKDIALYGIEDNVLYKKNLELLKTVMNDGREAMRSLNSLSAVLKRMEGKIYSPRINKFLEVSRLHKDSRSSFADYWNYVSAIARENNIDIKRFENISRMLASIELEKVINFDHANDERKILIDELSKRIVKAKLEDLVVRSVDFKAGKISQGAFHRYLADLAEEERINPTPFKNLINFAKYVSVYEEIDVITLHSEFDALEASIRDRLFSNDDEKALYDLEDKARILKGLFDISLSNGDTGHLIKHKDEFNAAAFESFIDMASQKYGIATGRPQYDLKAVFDRTDEAIKLYNVAQERNNAMLKNTIWRMKEEGKHVAALITGGFHSQGISELMKEQGLSYMVIMPKFEAGEDRPYIAILTKKPEPYQALVKSGEYKLAVYQYFSTGDMKDLAYAIALNLKEVAPGDLEEIKKGWAGRYKLVYESLPENREKSVAAKRLAPEEFDGILKLFTAETIIKLSQTEKTGLNGEKVLDIIGYGKPAVAEVPVAAAIDMRAAVAGQIVSRFLDNKKIEIDLGNDIKINITMRQAIGIIKWHEKRIGESRNESLSAIAKIALSLGEYFKLIENLTGFNKTVSGEKLSEKDYYILTDTMRDRINNTLLVMSISSERGIESVPQEGKADDHILRLHKSILELEGVFGGLAELESFDTYEKHPGYSDIRFANKPLKDPIAPVDPAALGLTPKAPPAVAGAITLYSFPGMLFDLELYKKMFEIMISFFKKYAFRKFEFTNIENFVRKARAGDEFIIDLSTELPMDMDAMRALLRSRNYIVVGRIPDTNKYKFRMGGRKYVVPRDLGGGFEYEGCVRPPAGRDKDIAHLPLREDMQASKDDWMYIISEKGVTWFRANPMFVTAIYNAKKSGDDYLKFLRLLARSDPAKVESMFEEEFTYEDEMRAAIDFDFKPNMMGKKPLSQFQAFIDHARWQYYHHEDKLVVDNIEFERDAEGVKLLKDHLAAASRLVSMNIDVEFLGTLKFMVDTQIIELCSYYRINLEKLLRQEIAESLKVRGLGAYAGVEKSPITIGMLDKSSAIIEDHQRNNFIGINRIIFDRVVLKAAKERRKDVLEMLLVVGITHELRHESGESDEARITEEDKILTAVMSTTGHRKHVIGDIIRALKSVSSDSLYIKALEELPPLLPEPGEFPLFEEAGGIKTEQVRGAWDMFARTLKKMTQHMQIPWSHKQPIAELKQDVALNDTEAFKIRVVDDHVLIATRKRAGSSERIEGMMAGIKGIAKGYAVPPEDMLDRNGKRMTVEVYCFKASNSAAKSEVLALLQSNDINYRGNVTMPNYTTSGLLAQLVTKEYELEKPPKATKYIESRTLEVAIKQAREKMALHIAEMGSRDADLAASFLDDVDSILKEFNLKAYEDPTKGLHALYDIINETILPIQGTLKRNEVLIQKAEDALGVMRREIHAGNLAYIEQAKNLRAQLDLAQVNREHYITTEKMFRQLWFYLLNPEDNFEEKTTEIRSIGPMPEGAPIILFVKTLEPIKLDFLRKRYNIQGIVAYGATITSHWVVYAKNNDIPVMIVDLPKQRSFAKEIGSIMAETQAMLEKNSEQASLINKKMAIITSDSTGSGEVILRPHIETIKAVESMALTEMAINKASRESASTPRREVALGYTGLNVALMANADNIAEAKKAVDHQSAGLGLVRTEYLFGDGNIFSPDNKGIKKNECVEDYLELFFMANRFGSKRHVRERLKDKLKEYFKALAKERADMPATIRMIDFEPDKISLIHSKLAEKKIDTAGLSGVGFYKSELGRDILSIELEAAMEAYLEGSTNIRVLFPMVSSMEDVRYLIHSRQNDAILEKAKNTVAASAVAAAGAEPAEGKDERLSAVTASLNKMPVGIMIETDEARRNRRELVEAEAVDFYSIGTNDFSRFVMGQALGLNAPLDRDNPFDREFLSILQTEVLKGVTEILEVARDVNRKRIAQNSHPKELCFCGEMASWYNFLVFLVLKADKLGLKPGEIPLSLSMSGYRVPEVSMFLESIGEGYYEGINTFLKAVKDELGIVSVDYLAGRIATEIFNNIRSRSDIADERRAISEELKAKNVEELSNAPEGSRTLYTLELLSRKGGKVGRLSSRWIRPPQVALAKIKTSSGVGTSVQPTDIWSPASKRSETFKVVSGIHKRPASHIIHLLNNPKYINKVRMFTESVQRVGEEKKVYDERIKESRDIMYHTLHPDSLITIRFEGVSEELVRDFLKDLLDLVDDTRNQKIFALVPKTPPAEPHAFKLLSGWSFLGLGGGVDWPAIFGVSTGYLTYSMVSNWDSISSLAAGSAVTLAIVSLIFTVTSFIRVWSSISAIRFAHPDFSIWRILTHDIGHDIAVLERIKAISPSFVYDQIMHHESYRYHIFGLLPFVPGLTAITIKLIKFTAKLFFMFYLFLFKYNEYSALMLLPLILPGSILGSLYPKFINNMKIVNDVDRANVDMSRTPHGLFDMRDRFSEGLSDMRRLPELMEAAFEHPKGKFLSVFYGNAGASCYIIAEKIYKEKGITSLRIKYFGSKDTLSEPYRLDAGSGTSIAFASFFKMASELKCHNIQIELQSESGRDRNAPKAYMEKFLHEVANLIKVPWRVADMGYDEHEGARIINYTYDELLTSAQAAAQKPKRITAADKLAIIKDIDEWGVKIGAVPIGYDDPDREKNISDAVRYKNTGIPILLDKKRKYYMLLVRDVSNPRLLSVKYLGIGKDLETGTKSLYDPISDQAKHLSANLWNAVARNASSGFSIKVSRTNIAYINMCETMQVFGKFKLARQEEAGDFINYVFSSEPIRTLRQLEYKELFDNFIGIDPQIRPFFDQAAMGALRNHFELDDKGLLKKESGAFVPATYAATGYNADLALIDSEYLNKAGGVVAELGKMRDDFSKLLSASVPVYRIEDKAFHISVAVIQEIFDRTSGQAVFTPKELEDLYNAFIRVAGSAKAFTLQLQGVRVGRDGGVIAIWDGDDTFDKIRWNFYKEAHKIVGHERLAALKPRITIHTTLMRILDDSNMTAKALKGLQSKARAWRDITRDNITLTVNQLSINHETQWLRADNQHVKRAIRLKEKPHAFKLLSVWSFLGLGGGADWAAIFGGLTAYLVAYMYFGWNALSSFGAANTIILAIISLMFTVTSFIRVWASISAIRFAHPDLPIWRVLTHDIGHDIDALSRLREIAPYTYKHIVYHETFKYHFPGLSAFIPLLRPIKGLIVKTGIKKTPEKYWMPRLHKQYIQMDKEGAVGDTGSPKHDKALKDAIDLIKAKGFITPEQFRLLGGDVSIVITQNREYLADVFHDPSGKGWIVSVNQMILDNFSANEDVMKTKLAYLLARQFDNILFEKFTGEHNVTPAPSLAETTTITLLRDTSRLNEHKDDCSKLMEFHRIMRILQGNKKYFSFEDHYSKLVETIQGGVFYGINFMGQPAWLDHIIAFYKNNKRYYGVKWYQRFDGSITMLEPKHILKYLRWYENNADFWLKAQLEDDKAVLATPAGDKIPVYYDGGNKNYTKEYLRDRLMPPEDKNFLYDTILGLYGNAVGLSDISEIFVHYLGSGNMKDAFSCFIVTKDGPFEFVLLLPLRKASVAEGRTPERNSLLLNLTELEMLKWASVQYPEHAPRVGSVIYGREEGSVRQMSVSYAGEDLSGIVRPDNKKLTPEAKREFLRACVTSFGGSIFRMKGFKNVGDWKPANAASLDWKIGIVDFGNTLLGDKNIALTKMMNFIFFDGAVDWYYPGIGFGDDKVRAETFFNGIIDVFANYSGSDRSNISEPYRMALGINLLCSIYEEPYRFLDEEGGVLDQELKYLLKDDLPRLLTKYRPSYVLGEKTLIEDFNWEHVRSRFMDIKHESVSPDFNSTDIPNNSRFPANPYWYIARSADLRPGVTTVDDLTPEEMKKVLDFMLMDHMSVPSDEYLIVLKKLAARLNVGMIPPASKEEYRADIRTLAEQAAALSQNIALKRKIVAVNSELDGDMILGLSAVQVRNMLSKLAYLPQNYSPTLDNMHIAMRKEEVVLLKAMEWVKTHRTQEGDILKELIDKATGKFLKFGIEADESEIAIDNEELSSRTIEYLLKYPNGDVRASAELLVDGAVAKGVTKLIVSDAATADAVKESARERGFLLEVMLVRPTAAQAAKEAAMPRAPPMSEISRKRMSIEDIDNASIEQGLAPLGYGRRGRAGDINEVLGQGAQALVTGSSLKQLIIDEEKELYYAIVDIHDRVLEITDFAINKEAAGPQRPDRPVGPITSSVFRNIVRLARKLDCIKIVARVPLDNGPMIDIFNSVTKYVHVVSDTSEIEGGNIAFTYQLVSAEVAAHKPGEKPFDEPALEVAYNELYKNFNEIKPEGGKCLDPVGLANVSGRFERVEGSPEFKRDPEGRLVPIKDDAYLGLIDLSILPQSSAVSMLNQLRDEVLSALPKEVIAYKVEDVAYHITILVIREIMAAVNRTPWVTQAEKTKLLSMLQKEAMPTVESIEGVSAKELKELLAGFKRIVSDHGAFKLRLEGLRIGADGGVIAVWKDSGQTRHIRDEFNKKVLLKQGGPRRLVEGKDKDRLTIHTTLLRIVTDVDPKTLSVLKQTVDKYKDISAKNITIDVNQISICHENQWLHAQRHKTEGPPIRLKKPGEHAFRAFSLWSAIGLGGGVDWALIFGAGAVYVFNAIIDSWDTLSNVSIGSYVFFGVIALAGMMSALYRIWHVVTAILIANPELNVWQALRHDIGQDDEALRQLKELSPSAWYQIKYHELFGSHVAGLWAFIPGAIRPYVVARIDDIEKTRGMLAIAEDEYEAVIARRRMLEAGAPKDYIKLADDKIEEFRAAARARKEENIKNAVKRMEGAVTSAEANAMVAGLIMAGASDDIIKKGDAKVAELRDLEAEREKLKAQVRRKILVGIPVFQLDATGSVRSDRIISDAVKQAAGSIPEEVIVVFFEDTGDVKKNVREVERIAQNMGAALGIALDKDVIENNISHPSKLENLARDLLVMASRNLFVIGNPDIAKLDKTRAELLDEKVLSRIESVLNTMLPPAASKDMLKRGVYNMRMEAVAEQAPGLPLEDRLRVAKEATLKGKKIVSIRADSLGELKLLAEAHRSRMKLAGFFDRERIPLRLQVRLTVTTEEHIALSKKMPDLLRQMAIDDILFESDVVLVDKDKADTATVKSIYDNLILYGPGNITIVERLRDGRDESEVPEGAIFMEYNDTFVTPYHYDAAIEAMTKPGEPFLSDRYKKWLRIKPVEKFDLEQLRRELDQYKTVLMAA